MRIAVCATNTDQRQLLSRVVDETLSPKGIIPQISIFPLPYELLETTAGQDKTFDLVLLSDYDDKGYLSHLCRLTPVILIGQRHLGPTAFEVGAAYFVESPAEPSKLTEAIGNWLERNRHRYLRYN